MQTPLYNGVRICMQVHYPHQCSVEYLTLQQIRRDSQLANPARTKNKAVSGIEKSSGKTYKHQQGMAPTALGHQDDIKYQ